MNKLFVVLSYNKKVKRNLRKGLVFMARALTEYEVENNFIDRLEEMGFDFIQMSNYDDVVNNFREQICKVNESKLIEAKGSAELSDTEFDRIMTFLEGRTIYESAKILRDQFVLDLDNDNHVYIDFLTPDTTRNRYQVTHQVTMDKSKHPDVDQKNRYDVTVLINGLPLVQIELKRPGVELNEAINQINRYRNKSFKGLFKYIQVFVVSNSAQTKYFANVNENNPRGEKQNILKSLVFYWTDKENKRFNKLIEFTDNFFAKDTITDLLTKYYIIKETDPILMVMRPYQIYAVKESVNRVIGSSMNGYVFHTTGSGKTLTSYKLATILRDNKNIEKVIFLIDRKDLDDQTVDEYNSFEKKCVDNTDDTESLVTALQDTGRTLIISTIQKMASALRSEKYNAIMDIYRNKRCVFIIDECHRSQFGKMHTAIEKHFLNASYIGFTGTPIFSENKGKNPHTTDEIFAPIRKDNQPVSTDIKACIHKYMIKEAIADGNVLPFSVEYMRNIKDIRLLEKSIDIDMEKIDDAEYCKKNNIDIYEMYHKPERIKFVADDIMSQLGKHTRLENDDVYTALFAVDKIKYLMQYYRCLKNHPLAYNKETNPNGYKIAAIFTFQQNGEDGNDPSSRDWLQECMDDYKEMFGTAYDVTTFDAYRKDVSKRMKQKDLPQVDLLLVVSMFLTGFDSKATNTLILDKDLIYHSLLQAYSRTNRVDKKTKQFGQVITYRNIKDAQDRALKLFSGGGKSDDFLVPVYEVWVDKYIKTCKEVYDIAPDVDVLGNMQSEDDKRKFVLAFRKLAGILATLKTFSKFDWKDLDEFMDEGTYADYKSWYLQYYDETRPGKPTTSPLVDIDFEIELVRTDRVNVVYILNLLKDINRNDMIEREKSIDLIMREIDRSDNVKLRYKREVLKQFINERFFELDPNEDIFQAYAEYEKESMQERIDSFAKENELDVNLINSIVSEYFADTRTLTPENLRQKLKDKHYGLLKLRTVIPTITNFVKEMENVYTAEGI